MKKLCCTFIFTLLTITTHSQINYGIKGGLNFNSPKEANIGGTVNGDFNAENRLGYHLGVFIEAKVPVLGIFVRPEVNYTSIKSEYNGLVKSGPQALTINKIDVPVLIGAKIIGPLRVFLGPSLQYIIKSDFEINEFKNVNTDAFSVGMQVGVGLQFGKLGIDARWERGLSKSESKFATDANLLADPIFMNVEVNFDTRPNQFILSLSYRL